MADTKQLLTIQVARGMAAILVVLAHYSGILSLPRYSFNNGWGFDYLSTFGRAGVDFFFVISGFIIYWIHRKDFGQANRLGQFVRKRVIRIYPLYIAVFFATLFFHYSGLIVSTTGIKYSTGFLLKNLLLIPSDSTPVVNVSWTLSHEMLFYALFSLLLVNEKMGKLLLCVWFVAIAAGILLPSQPFPINFLLDPRNLGFFVGLFLGYTLNRKQYPPSRFLLYFGLLLFFGVGAARLVGSYSGYTPIYAIGAFFILWPLIYSERKKFKVAMPKILALIGDSSYAIYLTHPPIGAIIIKIIFFSGFGANWSVYFILLVAALTGIALGVCVHLILERPLARIISKRKLAPHVIAG